MKSVNLMCGRAPNAALPTCGLCQHQNSSPGHHFYFIPTDETSDGTK